MNASGLTTFKRYVKGIRNEIKSAKAFEIHVYQDLKKLTEILL